MPPFISRLVSVASRDLLLKKEHVFLKELQAGVEKTLVFRQPVIPALFLAKHLHQSCESDSNVDRGALCGEI